MRACVCREEPKAKRRPMIEAAFSIAAFREIKAAFLTFQHSAAAICWRFIEWCETHKP